MEWVEWGGVEKDGEWGWWAMGTTAVKRSSRSKTTHLIRTSPLCNRIPFNSKFAKKKKKNPTSLIAIQITSDTPFRSHTWVITRKETGYPRDLPMQWTWVSFFRTLLSSCLFDELLHKCWSDWNNNCHAESMPKLSKMGQIYWKAIWCSYSCAVPFPKTQRVFQTS